MNKKEFKISIITPSFNSASYIERAIKSVLVQDYKNFEHIIIDGGSDDGTIDILKKYKHLVWISEKDNGQADAMNKGFKKSTGDIIVYLNADDYFSPDVFNSVIKKFKKGASFVIGNVLVKSPRQKSEFLNIPRITLDGMLRHWEPNAFSHNPVGYFYIRKVQELCPFNSLNYSTMDLEFLLDASSKFTFTKINKTLGCFEDGNDTKTAITQSKLDYWQNNTFPYIEKYINLLPIGKKNIYERDRRKGYIEMQEQMNHLNKDKFKKISNKNIPLISVIIPTYNCKNYISKTIESVLSQNLINLEIIIIDDFSSDGTQDFLKKKYGNNPIVKIICQLENKKQGAARNRGIEEASGKYLFFLDSDDWIEKGALIHLSSIAEEYNAEIVACGVDKVWEDGRSELYHSFAFACGGGIEALNYFNDYQIGSIVWNKLYSRKFIIDNKLRFIVSYFHEDVIFTANAIYLCNKYISINDSYYRYLQRKTSTINSKQTDLHLKSYIRLYLDMATFININSLCKDEYGKIISRNLFKAHLQNDILPKIKNYSEMYTQIEWEKKCWDACFEILGSNGYTFAVILIDLIKVERDSLSSINIETIKLENISRNKFIQKFILKMKIREFNFKDVIYSIYRKLPSPIKKIYRFLKKRFIKK